MDCVVGNKVVAEIHHVILDFGRPVVPQSIFSAEAKGPPAAQAAKRATAKVPVVFTIGDDPIKIGLVSSLSRPSANVTGVSMLFSEVQAKRLELLREIIPTTKAVGFVYDPAAVREEVLEPAMRRVGLQLYAAPATSEDELDAAFASCANRRGCGSRWIISSIFQLALANYWASCPQFSACYL
jgi:putative ABC transport system substrate-binding protein